VSVAVALLTRDLRTRDNPVLTAAAREADQVVPLFVLDPAILRRAHGCPNRFGFLCESLADLDAALRTTGGRLIVREGDGVVEAMRIAHENNARTVHVARDVSGFAQRRSARLRTEATRHGIAVTEHEALGVVAPDTFGKPYQVFTPYYRRWLAALWRSPVRRPRIVVPPGIGSAPLPSGTSPGDWRGGETAGTARLRAWTPRRARRYPGDRDRPGVDGTARLSPYLHFGCISPAAVARRNGDRGDATAWVRQLCWRDFFMQLLWWKPELSHTDLRAAGAPQWIDDHDALAAWRDGRTGYPLVDAGMRQLRTEGWMHNRVRMVVASFLTKDLRIDWRVGAAHFMDLLVDGDVAVNQLSWQWVAGTGAGSNPHRVMNPTTQENRNDPDGAYIRRWVDEIGTSGYPTPIVDHDRAIAAWRHSLGQSR
jgi:deoxyribodipyrimidine photo-lyase